MSSRIGVVPRHLFARRSQSCLRCVSWAPAPRRRLPAINPRTKSLAAIRGFTPTATMITGTNSTTSAKVSMFPTSYLPAGTIGALLDSSGHFNGGQDTDLAYHFRWPAVQVPHRPDFAVCLGFGSCQDLASHHTVDAVNAGPRWAAAAFDWAINQICSIRLAQVDYIYTNYPCAAAHAWHPVEHRPSGCRHLL